jgi:glycosyltransferase involved in cell wall biosynthesis
MPSVKVSIIVPVYNVEKYIRRCLDSVLSQIFTDFECILVNDCSPDKCPEICNEYAKKDARVKVIHKIQNEGLPQARKTGFENSSGEYIIFIDSDDWIEPNMIEKLYSAAFESNADIAACDFYKYNEHGYEYGIQTLDTVNYLNNLGFVHWCAIWNKLLRREIAALVKFPKAGKYEDRVITQQALYYSRNIVKVPCPLYHYAYNQESTFRGISVNTYSGWIENILFVINFLQDNLKEKFVLKEKNINEYVNNFKFVILSNRELRREKRLLNFYPQSGFKKWLFIYLIKSAVKYILPHGLYISLFKRKFSA